MQYWLAENFTCEIFELCLSTLLFMLSFDVINATHFQNAFGFNISNEMLALGE
jgi:hypothetical protein